MHMAVRDGKIPLQTDAASRLLQFAPRNRRRILCVSPRYANSFGTFNHAFPVMGGVKAFMPPQGLLLVAALAPAEWEVRFADENIRPVTEAELAWADAVFLSGMHIQRTRIEDLNRRAHAHGTLTVLGGPSASAAPDLYPEVDILHLGEVGDATLELFEALDRSVSRPPRQQRLRTAVRLPLTDFPSPAYHLTDLRKYLLGTIQFSSGCPFTCDFCDIPGLYGRNPRHKTPQQVVAELDVLADRGVVSVYFVDDNFIANPHAALELLPHLAEWQRRRDCQVRLSCEATLNIATYPKILSLMREAFFVGVFCGIETPEADALRAMRKTQNLRAPILEAVETIGRHGMEVSAGMIMGLDTDTDDTAQTIIEFTRAARIPIVTVNLLYALPGTPLHDRLARAGRLVPDGDRDSNVAFLRGYDIVYADWQRVVGTIYEPNALYERFAHHAAATYPHRLRPRYPRRHVTGPALRRALAILARMIWRIGIRGDYRRHFWRMAWRTVSRGRVETLFQVTMIAHHLITYARECTRGLKQASHYSAREIEAEEPERPVAVPAPAHPAPEGGADVRSPRPAAPVSLGDALPPSRRSPA
jgi:hopanoid C-2 methylase